MMIGLIHNETPPLLVRVQITKRNPLKVGKSVGCIYGTILIGSSVSLPPPKTGADLDKPREGSRCMVISTVLVSVLKKRV